MNVYGVKHDANTSMYNLKSKGFAEQNIQTVENILQKCDDPYLASTKPPLDHQLKSPARQRKIENQITRVSQGLSQQY